MDWSPFLPYMPMPDWMKPDPMMPIRGPEKRTGPNYRMVPTPTPGHDIPEDWKPGNQNNIDPGFDPHWKPDIPSTLPDWAAGYDNPNYGLPADSGGSFVGWGRFEVACNIPNDLQPSIPPGGLFGPEVPMPGWDDPEYKPPPDFTFPINGPEIMPEYHDDPRPSCRFYDRELSQYESFNPGAGLEIDPGSHQATGGPPSGPHILPAYPGGNKPDLPANARTLNRDVFAKKVINTDYQGWLLVEYGGMLWAYMYVNFGRSAPPATEEPEDETTTIHTGEGVIEATGVEYVDGETRGYNKKGKEGKEYQEGEARRHRRNQALLGVAIAVLVVAAVLITVGALGGLAALGLALRGLAARAAGRFIASRAGRWILGTALPYLIIRHQEIMYRLNMLAYRIRTGTLFNRSVELSLKHTGRGIKDPTTRGYVTIVYENGEATAKIHTVLNRYGWTIHWHIDYIGGYFHWRPIR